LRGWLILIASVLTERRAFPENEISLEFIFLFFWNICFTLITPLHYWWVEGFSVYGDPQWVFVAEFSRGWVPSRDKRLGRRYYFADRPCAGSLNVRGSKDILDNRHNTSTFEELTTERCSYHVDKRQRRLDIVCHPRQAWAQGWQSHSISLALNSSAEIDEISMHSAWNQRQHIPHCATSLEPITRLRQCG
jgi:hypothetical protein